jgi:epimerase EvaD
MNLLEVGVTVFDAVFDTAGKTTMLARELAVEGAYEFTPRVFRDNRGLFLAPFQEPAFLAAVGRPLFDVAQTTHTVSGRGVLRGIHFTATPPGGAKYVYCSGGGVLDVVVDLRVGSPTFGQWDSIESRQDAFRAVYLPVGVGHAFVALEDNTVMTYLLSARYVPENELAVSPLDPTLALPIPDGLTPIQADRDRAAPSLAEAMAGGLLPDYRTCLELERGTS